MLIIVSRDHPGFYESLKPVQEANGRDRVILDRRVADRRRATVAGAVPERRKQQRRAPVPDSDRALMSVLGFMVLHPDGSAATASRASTPGRKPRQRAPAVDSRQRPGATTPRWRRAG